jgi:hypothetical protein
VEGLDELRVVTGSLPGAHQVGDFDSMHEDIFDVSITIAEGFVHEVYVRLVELAVTAPVKQRPHFVTDKALTGGPNAVKDPDKRLIRDFWQGLKQWFANELLSPLADKTQVQRIRKFEPVLGAMQQADRCRRLHENLVQSLPLGLGLGARGLLTPRSRIPRPSQGQMCVDAGE